MVVGVEEYNTSICTYYDKDNILFLIYINYNV